MQQRTCAYLDPNAKYSYPPCFRVPFFYFGFLRCAASSLTTGLISYKTPTRIYPKPSSPFPLTSQLLPLPSLATGQPPPLSEVSISHFSSTLLPPSADTDNPISFHPPRLSCKLQNSLNPFVLKTTRHPSPPLRKFPLSVLMAWDKQRGTHYL